MTAVVKIQRKGQVPLPTRMRSAVGLAEGDLIEASVQRGKIVLTPKMAIDRSMFPTADSDYTPAQRRIIDRDSQRDWMMSVRVAFTALSLRDKQPGSSNPN